MSWNSLLLLLISTQVAHLFRIPSGWSLGKRISPVVGRRVTLLWNSLQEVYIGNLPTKFDTSKLNDLLRSSGATGYHDVNIVPYGTGDEGAYGSVKFTDSIVAQQSVDALHNAVVMDKPIDVHLVAKEGVRLFSRSPLYNITRLDFANAVNQYLGDSIVRDCETFLYENRTSCVYLNFNTTYQVWRARLKLPGFEYGGHVHDQWDVVSSYQLRQNGVFIHNLHPIINRYELKRVMKEILGPDEVQEINLPSDFNTGKPKGFGFVYMRSAEGAEKAVQMLNGYKLMDRVLRAEKDMRSTSVSKEMAQSSFTDTCMYLGNVDPNESPSKVEEYLMEAMTTASAAAASSGGQNLVSWKGTITKVARSRSKDTGLL